MDMLFDERPVERKRMARKVAKVPSSHSGYEGRVDLLNFPCSEM